MNHLIQFRTNVETQLPAMAKRLGNTSLELAARHAAQHDNVHLVSALNKLNTRFTHDMLVKYLASVIPGVSIDDTAHHDIVLRTGRGGHILIEVKVSAIRNRKGKITNARGESLRVTLCALIADPDSPDGDLEILLMPATGIRRGGYSTKDGGWGFSLSGKRLEEQRQLGNLVPFHDGIEILRRIALPIKGRG